MSRVPWITETQKDSACTLISESWGAQLCCSWLSMGKATQISHGKNSHWENKVFKIQNTSEGGSGTNKSATSVSLTSVPSGFCGWWRRRRRQSQMVRVWRPLPRGPRCATCRPASPLSPRHISDTQSSHFIHVYHIVTYLTHKVHILYDMSTTSSHIGHTKFTFYMTCLPHCHISDTQN